MPSGSVSSQDGIVHDLHDSADETLLYRKSTGGSGTTTGGRGGVTTGSGTGTVAVPGAGPRSNTSMAAGKSLAARPLTARMTTLTRSPTDSLTCVPLEPRRPLNRVLASNVMVMVDAPASERRACLESPRTFVRSTATLDASAVQHPETRTRPYAGLWSDDRCHARTRWPPAPPVSLLPMRQLQASSCLTLSLSRTKGAIRGAQ